MKFIYIIIAILCSVALQAQSGRVVETQTTYVDSLGAGDFGWTNRGMQLRDTVNFPYVENGIIYSGNTQQIFNGFRFDLIPRPSFHNPALNAGLGRALWIGSAGGSPSAVDHWRIFSPIIYAEEHLLLGNEKALFKFDGTGVNLYTGDRFFELSTTDFTNASDNTVVTKKYVDEQIAGFSGSNIYTSDGNTGNSLRSIINGGGLRFVDPNNASAYVEHYNDENNEIGATATITQGFRFKTGSNTSILGINANGDFSIESNRELTASATKYNLYANGAGFIIHGNDTHYWDYAGNKTGIKYKGFGENASTGIGGNYTSLLPNSLVPKALVEAMIRDSLALLTPSRKSLPISFSKSDGWGGGVSSIDTRDYSATLHPTGFSTNDIVGESFMGASEQDGRYIWLAPQDYNYFVKYDVITGRTWEIPASDYTRVTDANSTRDKFNGVIQDGNHMWFCPSWTANAVKIHTQTHEITDFPINIHGDDMYNGIVATNEHIWFITHDAPDLVRINKRTEVIERFTLPTDQGLNIGDAAFVGGHFDGEFLWLHPRKSNKLIKVNPTTGSIVEYIDVPLAGASKGTGYYHGGTRVGNKLFMTPYSSQGEVHIYNTQQKDWTVVATNADVSQPFVGSTSNGRFVFMTNLKEDFALKIDVVTNEVFEVDYGIPTQSFGPAVFVGDRLYITPVTGVNLYSVEVTEQNTAVVTTSDVVTKGNIVLPTPVQVTGQGGVNSVTIEQQGATQSVDITNAGIHTDQALSVFATEYFDAGVQLDGTNGVSILLEVNLSESNNNRLISNVNNYNDSDGFNVFTPSGGGIAVKYGSDNTYKIGTGILPLNTYTKVVVTMDNTGRKIFIDGTEVTGLTGASTTTLGAMTGNIILGNTLDGSRALNGFIKQAKVYQRVLSSSEVSDWQSGIELSTTDRILSVSFNASTVSNTNDDISNAIYFGEESKNGSTRLTKKDGVLIEQKRIANSWETQGELTTKEQVQESSADVIVTQPSFIIHDVTASTQGIQINNSQLKIGDEVSILTYTNATQVGGTGTNESQVTFDDAATIQIAAANGTITQLTQLDLNVHGKTITLKKVTASKFVLINS